MLAEIYNELQTDDLNSRVTKKKHTGSKKCWLALFTSAHLPIKRIQNNEDELSFKYESIQSKKKKKPGKSVASVPGKLHLLAKSNKRIQTKLFPIPKDVKFSSFIKLKETFVLYIEDLIDFSSLKESSLSLASQKLMKADFHGCPLTVIQSRCPSYVGVEGIVIKETKNTFLLVLREDKIKSIPKAHSIFSVILHDFVFTLYGNQLIVKPGERAGKKFKTKPTVDL